MIEYQVLGKQRQDKHFNQASASRLERRLVRILVTNVHEQYVSDINNIIDYLQSLNSHVACVIE